MSKKARLKELAEQAEEKPKAKTGNSESVPKSQDDKERAQRQELHEIKMTRIKQAGHTPPAEPKKESPVMSSIKPHGERSGYMNRTVSLPPELVIKIEALVTMRKAVKSDKGRTFSAVITEGLVKVLEEEGMV